MYIAKISHITYCKVNVKHTENHTFAFLKVKDINK